MRVNEKWLAAHPGQELPPLCGGAGNTLLTMQAISDRATAILVDYSAMLNLVRREDQRFTKKIGEQYIMRMPEEVAQTTGRVASLQALSQTSVTLTINQQEHQAWPYTVQELSLSIDNYSDLIVEPRASQMVAGIESYLQSLYTGIYNAAGTPGTTPNSYTLWANAFRLLDENGVLDTDRWVVMNSAARWAFAEVLHDLPTVNTNVPEQALTKGLITQSHDARKGWHMSNGVRVHTNGAFGDSTPLTNGTTADGATQVVTNGWESGVGTVATGDVFTLAGVYAVHPQTRQSTGQLQQFVVTSGLTATGGDMTIPISPTIHASGRYQNVTATPANDAAVTLKGSASGIYPQNLVGRPDAFALAMVDQDISDWPQGGKSEYKGIRLATVKGTDVINHQTVIRMDSIYGATLYQKRAVVRQYG